MLFDPYVLGRRTLRNRIVMAPMTRSRASTDHVPTSVMVDYYAQRADIGLIITEGTSPSPDGLGYARIPGLYNAEHVAAWKRVTDAVHAKGGTIFVQLMHTGRVSSLHNLPAGARTVGASSIQLGGQMYTDQEGMVYHDVPHALTEAEVAGAVAEYVQSARLAIDAGFDGVELHGANGYLIDQFLNANVNTRTDGYGGSAAGRNRFAIEIARATVEAIGGDRVGMRISPFGVFNGMGAYEGIEEQYLSLTRKLASMDLVYLHLVDHSSMGAPPIPDEFKASLRSTFTGAFIASGGLDRAKAEERLTSGAADLAAFGKPALANPDLVERLRNNLPLNAPDMSTFYTPGMGGYTDYPALAV